MPAGLQGIIFSGSNVIIQSAVNSFGKIMIAGSSAAQNIEGFVYMAMNGISQGALTFTSQNYGSGKIARIKKVVLISMLSVFVVGLVLGNAAYFAGRWLLSFYTKNPQVIEAGMVRLFAICVIYFLCGTMDTMSNSIRGMGHSLLPMIVCVAGVCGIRILYIFTFFRIPEFHTPFSLFMSYPISWFITLLIHTACFIFIYRRICVKENSVKENAIGGQEVCKIQK